MQIIKSFWETLGAFDSSKAADRERFARKYVAAVAPFWAKRAQQRTSHFEFTDLNAQGNAGNDDTLQEEVA